MPTTSSSSSTSSSSLSSRALFPKDDVVHDFSEIKEIKGPHFSEIVSLIRNEILHGQVPVKITIPENSNATMHPPKPYYIMIPRHAYLHVPPSTSALDTPYLLYDVIKYFQKFIPTFCKEIWFTDLNTGQRLNDDLPVGVLFDMYLSNGLGSNTGDNSSFFENEVWQIQITSSSTNEGGNPFSPTFTLRERRHVFSPSFTPPPPSSSLS